MSAIEELQASIRTVAEAVGPSIVSIGRHGRGTGVVIAEGRVLTNAHNLRADTTSVTFADGRNVQGSVSGADLDGDLVVLKVDTAGAPAIAWSDGGVLAVGSVVFGVGAGGLAGNGGGGAASGTAANGPRVTFGTVTSIARAFRGPGGRRIDGSVEHTAPLARGSSGGPIVDAAGKLLGVNTNRIGEGFYLALPADAALRARVDGLARGESVERPRLGIAVAPSHVARRLRRSVGLPERDGVLVRGVEDGSPAARAGIAAGDLVVEVAGASVIDADGLVEALAAATAPYEVRLVRGAEERTVTVGGEAAATGEA